MPRSMACAGPAMLASAQPVPTVEREKGRGGSPRRGGIIGAYLLAAVLGYVLGARGLLPFGRPVATPPLAMLGFALRQEKVEATPEDWTALRAAVDVVRASWKGQEPPVLDLVVELRGLGNNGSTDWGRAEQLCRGLKWPRCDRLALEEMKRRSRP
jgi:hypothetical protein